MPSKSSGSAFDKSYPASQGAALATLWLPKLAKLSWAERLAMLDRIHEQVQDEYKDLTLYCEVFPIFVSQIVDALGNGPVTSREQAHIYANSAKESHRRAAGQWLAKFDKTR